MYKVIVFLIAAILVVTIGLLLNKKIFNKSKEITLENFDDVWNLGYPEIIEKKLRELALEAQTLKDTSSYLQILSQIALAQALQRKFDIAHKTLDDAQAMLTSDYPLAKVRILLERGRVFQQADNIPEARNYFEQSFELSKKHTFDYHTINAAHMIAIVANTTQEKIHWNQLALDMTEKTGDTRAQAWLGSLYNNLGQNYLEEKQFEKALLAFKKTLAFCEMKGYVPNIRQAKWCIARSLRSLNHLDEALAMQNQLVLEYDAIQKSGKYDVPVEMFTLMRGWVYEELAEIYTQKAKAFADLAYKDLAHDEMFIKTCPDRLERIKQIKSHC